MSNEYKDWYNDFSERQKKIYNICMEYPFLMPRDVDGNMDEDFDYEYLGFDIPVGWYRLFLQMCSDIKQVLEKEGLMDDFYFLQVKEKYNELRCYSNGAASLEVEQILQKYKYLSRYVCTECGRPAEYETRGYIASYCNDCRKDRERHEACNILRFESTYDVVGFRDGKGYSRTVSVEDEWNRYLKENGNEMYGMRNSND